MSKLIMFDFACSECAHQFEDLVVPGGANPDCPACKAPNATRQLAAPRIDPRLGVSSDFPTMADKWARVRRQREQHDAKLQRNHG